MKEVFNKTVNSIIISSILTLIVGIAMIMFPNVSIKTMGIVAAIYIILHGIALIFFDSIISKFYLPFDGLFSGLISIVIGVILLFKPKVIPVVFTIVLGMWIIIMSINYIKVAIKLRKTKLPWLIILLLGILDLLAGLIMIFNPFEAAISIVLFSGIMIIVHSFINIIDVIIIKKDIKEISNELTKLLKNAQTKNTNE